MGFLTGIFTKWVKKEGDIKFDIIAASKIGVYRSSQKYPRDILVKIVGE